MALESNIPPLLPTFLPKLTAILRTTPYDPAVIVSISIKLLGPVTFTQILTLADEESLITALRSPSSAANILAMTIIEKASLTPSDAAILSLMTRVIEELVRRWLVAPQVEVGEKGGKVIGDLLDVDCELLPPIGSASTSGSEIMRRRVPGQGRMWKRIFHDKEIFGLVLSICQGRDGDTALSEHQVTLAQGRLLRVIPRLASLNFLAVSKSEFPDLTGGPDRGILHFAALNMVDKKDLLMHLTLVDFFETRLALMRISEYSNYKMTTLRALVADATRDDNVLKAAILNLPDRTVPEEAELLRKFLEEIMGI
jgi:hypothetical protein